MLDLLDRLAFDVVTLPPLRERKPDIMLMAEHFAIQMCRELQLPLFPGFSEKAQLTLLNYGWPGNIRELKNFAERVAVGLPFADTGNNGSDEEPLTLVKLLERAEREAGKK